MWKDNDPRSSPGFDEQMRIWSLDAWQAGAAHERERVAAIRPEKTVETPAVTLPCGCTFPARVHKCGLPAEKADSEPPAPQTAEQKLCAAGVFKGAEGLRGLARAREFWERQPYGTRLYYGEGGLQYLHRSVLETAIDILDGRLPENGSAVTNLTGD